MLHYPKYYHTQHEKCLYLEFFWFVFFRISNESGNLLCISHFSVQMRRNMDQKTRNTKNFYALTVLTIGRAIADWKKWEAKAVQHFTSLITFYSNVLFLYPLKTTENLWFSEVFKKYRKRTLCQNELNVQSVIKDKNQFNTLIFYQAFIKLNYFCLCGEQTYI